METTTCESCGTWKGLKCICWNFNSKLILESALCWYTASFASFQSFQSQNYFEIPVKVMLFFFILFVRYSGLTSSLLIQFVSRFSIFCLHISIQQWSWFTRLQGEIDSSRGLLCVDKRDTSFCRVLKSHLTLHLPHVTHHVTTLIRWQTKRNIYTTPLPFQIRIFSVCLDA